MIPFYNQLHSDVSQMKPTRSLLDKLDQLHLQAYSWSTIHNVKLLGAFGILRRHQRGMQGCDPVSCFWAFVSTRSYSRVGCSKTMLVMRLCVFVCVGCKLNSLPSSWLFSARTLGYCGKDASAIAADRLIVRRPLEKKILFVTAFGVRCFQEGCLVSANLGYWLCNVIDAFSPTVREACSVELQ